MGKTQQKENAKMASEKMEKVNPIRFTADGTTYTLDFSRETAIFAQRRGVPLSEISDKATVVIQELWFCAFRMHHKNVARDKTDAMLTKFGGLKPTQLERLLQLYQQASYAGVLRAEDEESGDPSMTLEMD